MPHSRKASNSSFTNCGRSAHRRRPQPARRRSRRAAAPCDTAWSARGDDARSGPGRHRAPGGFVHRGLHASLMSRLWCFTVSNRAACRHLALCDACLVVPPGRVNGSSPGDTQIDIFARTPSAAMSLPRPRCTTSPRGQAHWFAGPAAVQGGQAGRAARSSKLKHQNRAFTAKKRRFLTAVHSERRPGQSAQPQAVQLRRSGFPVAPAEAQRRRIAFRRLSMPALPAGTKRCGWSAR